MPEENEVSEMWRAVRKDRQVQRERNRDNGLAELRRWGIPHIVKNAGAHIIIEQPSDPGKYRVDYWPGTGLIHMNGFKSGRGIQCLLDLFGVPCRDNGRAGIGDRVKYRGRFGIVIRDRMNGMVDIAFDGPTFPMLSRRNSMYYTCGGTAECIYRDELEKIEGGSK